MSIEIQDQGRRFSLKTRNSLYQMKADDAGVLRHLYYGRPADDDMSYRIRLADRGFSGNPYEKQDEREYSLDTIPQEYGTSGVGDYRTPSVLATHADGSASVDFRFTGYRLPGRKEPLADLPSARGGETTESLEITLTDEASGINAVLIYSVFPEEDAITRSVRIENRNSRPVTIRKAASYSVDFPYGGLEMVHFHGRHCMEQMPERMKVPRGASVVSESRRGTTSHHSNPFVILCEQETTERQGCCWGFMLEYSGNHLEEVGTDQTGSLRITGGIHPERFSWQLASGESFQTPEAILSFSSDGFNGLSRNLHRMIRNRIIPEAWQTDKRPVLINSWEANYFDFNRETLLDLGRNAAALGIDMLVLDDGWFGKRNDDCSGLGDWIPNEKKLGCSLKELSEGIHDLGLKFGLWFEPEMISEDSDLFRKHPEWALSDPDRKPTMGRKQLVLDMSRGDIQEYLFQTISHILDSARIEYIKWDFNRSAANIYSHALPPERQGETAHRFVLGTYRLLKRLTEKYPELLIEGCSGGGGRFDAGMLQYCPQIWCSDDTDAVERLEIQRGTSYGYPAGTMGAHVSACPNHQTGRTVPFGTRGAVALAGTFGYELNPAILTNGEKEEIRRQIAQYHQDSNLVFRGDYYRLTEMGREKDFEAWMFVSPDRSRAVVTAVITHVRANGPFILIRLAGLEENRVYRITETDERITGRALMYGGYALPGLQGDYPAVRLHLKADNL